MKKESRKTQESKMEIFFRTHSLLSMVTVALLGLASIFVMIGLIRIMEYPHRTWAMIDSLPHHERSYSGRRTYNKYAFEILYSTEDGQIVTEDIEYSSSCRLNIESGNRIYIGYGKNKQGTYKATLTYTIDDFFMIAGFFICLWLICCAVALAKRRNPRKEDLVMGIGYLSTSILCFASLVLILMYPSVLEDAYKRFVGSMTIDFTNTVCLGSYEQDGDTSNGPEPIEWAIIDSDEDSITLMSKYIIDSLPVNYIREYNDSLDSVDQVYMENLDDIKKNLPEDAKKDWENSDLRQWLNNDFYNLAFSSEEKSQIQTVNLCNWNGAYYSRANSTEDKVYLLSSTETLKYQDIDNFMPCDYTDYAKERGKDTDQSGFFLRDQPGSFANYKIYTSQKSYFEFLVGFRFAPYSVNSSYLRYGIRPVIKIDKN